MKRLFVFTLVALVSVSTSFAQDEKTETKSVPWFDMEYCEICKNFSNVEGMMQHVKWETHLIPNGFLAVSVVPEKLKQPMAKAKKGMKQTIARIEDGENLKCCGYCQSMGSLLQTGAKMTEVSTLAGEITMLTSTNPDVVKKIQAHAKRTMSEHKKMMKQGEHADHKEHSGEHKKSDKIK